MSAERKAKLEALPWWSWGVARADAESAWNARFTDLGALGTPLWAPLPFLR
jgi:hypothetical protein